MGDHSLTRFAVALLSGILILGMILGSIQLAQVDQRLTWIRPTYISRAPTGTPYPTRTPAGDTPVPTGTPTPIPTSTPRSVLVEICEPPSSWVPYVIQPGDTLYRLALRAQVPVLVLMQENCLGDPNVRTGEIIHLPRLAVVSPTAPPYRCGPPGHWVSVRVRPGDTLYSLARAYGTTIRAIRQANCLVGYTIYAGLFLYLPPRAPTQTPTPRPTFTPTAAPTATPTATASPTLRPTPTLTPSVTITATVTTTPTATATAPASPTLTLTPSPTATASETVTATTPTFTPTPTSTPTVEQTPTFTFTPTGAAPTPTATETGTAPTFTFTPSPSPETPTPTASPTLTAASSD